MENDGTYTMVEIDEFECDIDECGKAYPHPLLLEKHKMDDHPEFSEELDEFIEGENTIEL